MQAVQAQGNLVRGLLAPQLPLEDALPGLVGARELVPQRPVLHVVHGQDGVPLRRQARD